MAKNSRRIDYTEVAATLGESLDRDAVILDNGCWIVPSMMRRDKTKGIAAIEHNGTKYVVPRIMYIHYNGPYNQKMLVKTTCETPNCINPEHLILKKSGNPDILAAQRVAMATFAERRREAAKMAVAPVTPIPTPTPEPHPIIAPPATPKAAQLSEDEILQIRELLRVARGVKAYVNGHR